MTARSTFCRGSRRGGKNTTERVGSATVRVFLSKLQEMRLDHGILVAADGVTGDG